MKHKLYFLQRQLLLCVFAFFFSSTLIAQKDTLFWFAAPQVSSSIGNSPVIVQLIGSEQPSTVLITAPANTSYAGISVNLAPFAIELVDITSVLSNFVPSAANVVGNQGLKITASTPISANYHVNSPNNKEIFTLKGNKALGTNFYTPFQSYWNNQSGTFSSIDIIATEDNTVVLITPRIAIVGHPANTSFSINLNKGQTYSARNTNVAASATLAGSIVSANKPIAVTVFEDGLVNGTCIDAIGEQLTNINQLGTKHIIHKGTGNSDRVFILATQNGTNLTIHGTSTTTATINWGETYAFNLTDELIYVESNKPIYVNHVMSMGCELGSSLIPNVYCAGDYNASAYRNQGEDFGLILYIRAGNEGLFTLNGSNSIIQASDFVSVPGTSDGIKIARKMLTTTELADNSVAFVENTGDIFGMAVIKGGATTGLSYSFVSEYASKPIVIAGADTSVCANVALPLQGIVGGGSTGGTWSSNGYGTFSNSLTSLTNSYIPSHLDVLINPIRIILSSDATCPSRRDTLFLTVNQLPIVNASADQTVCGNNTATALNGTIQGGASTGIWTSLNGGSFQPNATTLNATYIPSSAEITVGNATLVLTSTDNGTCLLERDTMQLFITTPPVVEIIPDTLFVCSNNATVTISGTVSGATTSGAWTSNGNGMFTPNNIASTTTYLPSVADINNTYNWIYLTSLANGICAPERDSVYIKYVTAPTVEAGENKLVCSNDPQFTLEGVVSGISTSGVWSGGNGTFTPSNTALNAVYTPTSSEIASGQVVLTLTTTNNQNCLAQNDFVQFLFVAPPHANFNGSNECLNETTQFTSYSLPGYGTIASHSWDFGDNTLGTQANPAHTYGQPGTYNVKLVVENNVGCKDSTNQTVEIFPLPIADFTFTAICDSNNRVVTFTDNSTSIEAINYWYYDFGGQGTTTSANAVLTFPNSGVYTISHIVSSLHGCSDTISKQLTIQPLPEAGFSYNFSGGANVGSTYNFVDTSNFAVSYHWNLGNGVISTEQHPSTVYFSNGLFPVVQYVYDQLGCFDSTIVWIEINNITTEISTLIPNVISPNGDGLNDIWKLSFIELLYPNATVEIFNEWGQLLYQSEGYKDPWDGRYNGEDVPDGNYFYVINLHADINPSIYKGALLVLRSKK